MVQTVDNCYLWISSSESPEAEKGMEGVQQQPFLQFPSPYWVSSPANTIAMLPATCEKQKQYIQLIREGFPRVIAPKMVLVHKDMQISTLEEIQKLKVKDLREILLSNSETVGGVKADLVLKVYAKRVTIG